MLQNPSRTSLRTLVVAASAGLIVVACGPNSAPLNQAPAQPPTTAVPTSPPAAAQPTSAAAAPTAVARPTQPTSTAAEAQTGAAPTATISASIANTANDPIRLVIDQSASQARYHAHEQLAGRNLPSEAVGTSAAVSGALMLGADGSVSSGQSQIQVDLRQLKSDESRRDTFIQRETLQTSQFPMATFVPKQVQGLPNPLPSSGDATFTMMGDLTVHGVTKPVTWQVIAKFADSQISGAATTQVNITDFGMTPPKAGPVLSIDDALTLEMVFTANREA
jgi:polyisoprenoid-binding protein YceI